MVLPLPPPKIYRQGNHLAETLKESLDELLAAGKITQGLYDKIWIHFDVRVSRKLNRTTPQMTFKGKLDSFKFVNQTEYNYELLLKNVELSVKNIATNDDKLYVPQIDHIKINAFPSDSMRRRLAMGLTTTAPIPQQYKASVQ